MLWTTSPEKSFLLPWSSWTEWTEVWTEVPVQDCMEKTGKPPIPVRWVITNKGDKNNYNVKARLVAKHIVAKYGGKGLHELFVAMPPFEMVELLLTRAVTDIKPTGERLGKSAMLSQRANPVRKVNFIDVSEARLHALITTDVNAYVDLPPECLKKGICGRLNYWLYGMRPASKGWETEYTKRLKTCLFLTWGHLPAVFTAQKMEYLWWLTVMTWLRMSSTLISNDRRSFEEVLDYQDTCCVGPRQEGRQRSFCPEPYCAVGR